MATAADLMTAAVPQAHPNAIVAETMEALRSRSWDEVGHIYLLDERSQLVGQVPIERPLVAPLDARLSSVRGNSPLIVRTGDDAETVAPLAVERHDADVAVLDPPRPIHGRHPYRSTTGAAA